MGTTDRAALSRASLKDRQRQWALQVLSQAMQTGWWGTLTFKIEGGEVKTVRKDESLKPPPH